MTLVIICRQIDISIGSQFGMCAVVAGLLAAAKLPLALVVLAAIGAGAAMGAINGALVAGLGLPSIVVTLATMVTWQEALRLWQQGRLLNLPAGRAVVRPGASARADRAHRLRRSRSSPSPHGR